MTSSFLALFCPQHPQQRPAPNPQYSSHIHLIPKNKANNPEKNKKHPILKATNNKPALICVMHELKGRNLK
jgi:hypothetical protein